MAFNKKQIAGIATVALAAAYSITHWRGGSDDGGEEQSVTEQ